MTRRVRAYSRFRDGFAILIVVAVAVGVGWLYLRDEARQQTEPGPSPTATPSYDTARHQMEALPVHGWDRVSDFQRFRFGEPWSDDVNVEFGHNGCNTRDDILRRDLADLQVRPGTCFAQSGVLHDPYTGAVIDFVRGPDTSPAGRSTMWWRWPTRGTRAPDCGTTSAVATSPTTRAICWPWLDRSTSTRLFVMPRRGCRRIRR